MTKAEVMQLVETLKVTYPNQFKGMGKDEATRLLHVYHTIFADDPPEVVLMGLHNYIKHNDYPPTPAGLQREITALVTGSVDTEIELWNKTKKYLKYYMTPEEFDEIPEPIKSWFGNITNLKEIAQMPVETVNTVVKGQFLKTIPQLIERQAEERAMLGREERLRLSEEELNI